MYIPKRWKIKLKLKTSYKMKNLGVLGHLTKRFQLLGLPTHLSGRRQTTLAFLRRSNSCNSSFLNNFINEVMVEDEMNNFINDRMKSLYFIGSKKNRLDEK